jgi:hypothetical protein
LHSHFKLNTLALFTQRDDWDDDDGGEGDDGSFADASSFCGGEMAFRWLGLEIWRSISRRCRRLSLLAPPLSKSSSNVAELWWERLPLLPLATTTPRSSLESTPSFGDNRLGYKKTEIVY